VRILFDTNTLIAAFVHNGRCYELVLSAQENHHELYCTEFIITELKDVLLRKFKLSEQAVNAVVKVMRNSFIRGISSKGLIEPVCRDRKDDQILADAQANKIDLIITGDKDLLTLNPYNGIKILLPHDSLELL
jgi:uncharacterized protein